jgi:hypothetical protein
MVPSAFRSSTALSLKALFNFDGHAMHVVDIHPDAYLIPQARFGQPIEDQDPQLPREEFKEQMRWSEF